MISFDCDAWEDDVEDGRRQLAEYELYIYEPDCKSRALLSRPDALVLARPFADELAHLVQQYSVPRDGSTLAEMLRYTLADGIISLALAGPDNLVTQPVSRAGYFAVRQTLDAACSAFEALLAAEAAK
jgi:hypothetical protein